MKSNKATLTLKQLKQDIRRLKAADSDLLHSQAMERAAVAAGFSDWHEASIALADRTPLPCKKLIALFDVLHDGVPYVAQFVRERIEKTGEPGKKTALMTALRDQLVSEGHQVTGRHLGSLEFIINYGRAKRWRDMTTEDFIDWVVISGLAHKLGDDGQAHDWSIAWYDDHAGLYSDDWRDELPDVYTDNPPLTWAEAAKRLAFTLRTDPWAQAYNSGHFRYSYFVVDAATREAIWGERSALVLLANRPEGFVTPAPVEQFPEKTLRVCIPIGMIGSGKAGDA